MRGNIRYFKQLQPSGWANGEKNIIKGKKKSHFSRGIADFRSAPSPGDWISFFFFYFPFTCRHVKGTDFYKTQNTLASYYLPLIDNGADYRSSRWKTMREKNGEIDAL